MCPGTAITTHPTRRRASRRSRAPATRQIPEFRSPAGAGVEATALAAPAPERTRVRTYVRLEYRDPNDAGVLLARGPALVFTRSGSLWIGPESAALRRTRAFSPRSLSGPAAPRRPRVCSRQPIRSSSEPCARVAASPLSQPHAAWLRRDWCSPGAATRADPGRSLSRSGRSTVRACFGTDPSVRAVGAALAVSPRSARRDGCPSRARVATHTGIEPAPTTPTKARAPLVRGHNNAGPHVRSAGGPFARAAALRRRRARGLRVSFVALPATSTKLTLSVKWGRRGRVRRLRARPARCRRQRRALLAEDFRLRTAAVLLRLVTHARATTGGARAPDRGRLASACAVSGVYGSWRAARTAATNQIVRADKDRPSPERRS